MMTEDSVTLSETVRELTGRERESECGGVKCDRNLYFVDRSRHFIALQPLSCLLSFSLCLSLSAMCVVSVFVSFHPESLKNVRSCFLMYDEPSFFVLVRSRSSAHCLCPRMFPHSSLGC